ncbi:hypothetical protein HN51_056064, partial [Arachis hypogaea]
MLSTIPNIATPSIAVHSSTYGDGAVLSSTSDGVSLQQRTLSPLPNNDSSAQSRCTPLRTATARCSPRRARCSIARNPYPFSSPSYSSSIPLFPGGPSVCSAVIGATGELTRGKIFAAIFALYYSGFLFHLFDVIVLEDIISIFITSAFLIWTIVVPVCYANSRRKYTCYSTKYGTLVEEWCFTSYMVAAAIYLTSNAVNVVLYLVPAFSKYMEVSNNKICKVLSWWTQVHEYAILLNLGSLQAISMKDCVLIFEYNRKGGQAFLESLLPRLNPKNSNGGLSMPFELE